MGINDVVPAHPLDEEEVGHTVTSQVYPDDKAALCHKKKKERTTVKSKARKEDDSTEDKSPASMGKNKKRNIKINETDTNSEHQAKKKMKMDSNRPVHNEETKLDTPKKTKPKLAKSKLVAASSPTEAKSPKSINAASSDVKTSAKKNRSKPVLFVPFENDVIPEAHLSLRACEEEDEEQEKKKVANKSSKKNSLVFTVISDVNLTLKPHECHVFKLNGFLQSPVTNLVINLYSYQSISYDHDLCALNWEIVYNNAKRELIIPIYNRGNRVQKVQANDAIAIIRLLSPEDKLMLKN